MNKGVYIHIPFCKSICSYCDFCKLIYKKEWVKPYLKKLNEEIKDLYNDEEINTMYIGGGTPSALSLDELNILFTILKRFKTSNIEEFTFECNLNDINRELLELLKENNVNRLSIGIESFDKDTLKNMNRLHTFEDALEKINLCKAIGFNNINVDLIYGFNNQTLKTLKKDLKLFMKLKVNHISTYSLILEDNSVLGKKGYEVMEEDLDYEMYNYICKYLKKHGYRHYEISNFAKDNTYSKHNLKYWNNLEYYGFGLGASGYIDGVRYTNTSSLKTYIESEEISTKELLTQKDIMDNEIMLGLRKLNGINIKKFEEKYKVSLKDTYPIIPLIRNKELEITKYGNIKIPDNKIYIMNEIIIKLI